MEVASVILAIHVIGASIWVGSSIFLGMVAVVLRTELKDDRALYSQLMSRVARTGGVFMWGALAVTILTGLYNLSWFLPSPITLAAVEGTPWLMTKLGLVFLMVVLAGVHSFALGPMIMRRQGEGKEGAVARLRMASNVTSMLGAVLGITVLYVAVMLAGGA